MDFTYVIVKKVVKVYVTERNYVINATVMTSQYGGRQQSKWLHY